MNWRVALMELIASRLAIIQLESKELAASTARRAIFLIAAAGCAVATWILSLAGGISWLAQATGWHWSRVALGTAVIHFIVGMIFARKAVHPLEPAFSAARNEFKKDREWIENFHTTKKSND